MCRLELDGIGFLDRGPVDLTIHEAECVSLMGASGSGKTLLLRAVADLDAHDGGCRLRGDTCASMPAPEWRRRVGMLPAESQWWAETVEEHFPAGADGRDEVTMEALGFDASVWKWSVHRLSTGERQRLALARLLANRPEALLLDEPTASLDSANIENVESIIASYKKTHGAAVLWVSHDPEQAGRVAARCFRLEGGVLTEA